MSNQKRYILTNISKLHEKQKKELIELIQKMEINFMENNNGIFVELNDLPTENIDQIFNFIEFCITQKHDKIIETEEEKNFNNLEFFIEQNKEKEVVIIKKPVKIEEFIEKPNKKNIKFKEYQLFLMSLSKKKVI